jgi:four helix bundle protein
MKDENQDLRKRTKDFALRIIKLYTALPRHPVAQTFGHQLLRSGRSVAQTIARLGAFQRRICIKDRGLPEGA